MLGANDGIVSTAALIVGVAASGASPGSVLTSGIAGAVAGAMSMAAGEYVSVRSQADTEAARARDELGITDTERARPIQAAWTSAASFAAGSILPLAGTLLAPSRLLELTIA